MNRKEKENEGKKLIKEKGKKEIQRKQNRKNKKQ